LQPLAQHRPATGVARHSGPRGSRRRWDGTRVLLFVKPAAKQAEIPLRSNE
jgi:hypothetical protein